jgi:hypothetical protein
MIKHGRFIIPVFYVDVEKRSNFKDFLEFINIVFSVNSMNYRIIFTQHAYFLYQFIQFLITAYK